MKNDTPQTTSYGVPCMASFNGRPAMFLLKFQTKNEDEARRLARCVCGPELSNDMLLLIDQNNDCWPVN